MAPIAVALGLCDKEPFFRSYYVSPSVALAYIPTALVLELDNVKLTPFQAYRVTTGSAGDFTVEGMNPQMLNASGYFPVSTG